ncbi:MAG TPA: adenylate/guanylate cyclase domain-containing protein [Aeromicrobium sp.]|nr:adenylate/guanylate cyclase domain-containing protein [Aeromicrobium sp.]
MVPETRYAKKGDISIAYQVVGDGPIDLVFSSGIVSNLALMWSDPEANAMFRRVASFTRLIMFDKPGTGMSDPVAGPPTAEQRVEDIVAVMDAVGAEHAAIAGYSEGGTPAMLFAATYPERCDALILLETAAKWTSAPGYLEDLSARLQYPWDVMLPLTEKWGSGSVVAQWGPTVATRPAAMQLFGSAERVCASPGMAKAVMGACLLMDVRAALPQINVPTLIIHRTDSFVPVELSHYLAAEIDRAHSAFLPGKDHILWFGDWRPIVDEIEEFLTGTRHRADPDRALATIMFTDIVSSTERTSQMGDERWRGVVERHDDVMTKDIERWGGRPVKTLGDGFLAVFDGPAKAVRCARAMTASVRELGIEIRAGIHAGECERRGDDVAGIAVNVAARISALGTAGEVLVSSTVRELVLGSGLEFTEHGVHQLKGVPDEWRLYAVTADGRTDARPVSEVAPQVAALTPGPMETLRPRDRAFLAAAKRTSTTQRLALGALMYGRKRGRHSA